MLGLHILVISKAHISYPGSERMMQVSDYDAKLYYYWKGIRDYNSIQNRAGLRIPIDGFLISHVPKHPLHAPMHARHGI